MADKNKSTPDDGGPENPADESKAGNPTPEPNDATAKPRRPTILSLRYEMTEEEKAEEKRRWKAIQAGLHPDTGIRSDVLSQAIGARFFVSKRGPLECTSR